MGLYKGTRGGYSTDLFEVLTKTSKADYMTCETSTSGPKPISKYPPVVVMETWTQSAVLGSGPWSPAQRIVGRNSHRGTASSCVGRRYDRRGTQRESSPAAPFLTVITVIPTAAPGVSWSRVSPRGSEEQQHRPDTQTPWRRRSTRGRRPPGRFSSTRSRDTRTRSTPPF